MIIIIKKYVYNISQLWLYNHLWVVLKRLQGIATKKEAEARDKYYENQSNYERKIVGMVYQKNPKFTLFTCDKPEFLKCREENPNKMEKVILV